MSKLREILEGWGNLIIKDPATEEEAKKRAKFCDTCEYLNTLPGGFYLHCGKCGCYIKAKIRSKTSECPLKKW